MGKPDGLYVVDVGDGEWAPVFSYDHSQARDRTRRGGRPDRSPFEVQGTAPGLQLSGVGLHWGKRFTAEHGDTMDSPQMETGTREKRVACALRTTLCLRGALLPVSRL